MNKVKLGIWGGGFSRGAFSTDSNTNGARFINTNKHVHSDSSPVSGRTHSPLSADHRLGTLRLGDCLNRGTDTSGAAGSGGTGSGDHGRGIQGGTGAGVGSCHPCIPLPGKAWEAAELGLRKAVGSLLSAEAGHGTSPPAETLWLPAVNQLRAPAETCCRFSLRLNELLRSFIKT